jgi:WD40 repeat protein
LVLRPTVAKCILVGRLEEKPLHKTSKVQGVDLGVSTVEICPKGRFLASAGQDGVLIIYQLCDADGGVDSLNPDETIMPQRIEWSSNATPELSIPALHHMAFSPDGLYCAACGGEGRVLLIELSTKRSKEFFLGDESDEALLFLAFGKEFCGNGLSSLNLALCSTKVTLQQRL